jgi:hypothetical protein
MHSTAPTISVNVRKVAEDEIASSADLIRQRVSVSQNPIIARERVCQAGRADLGLLKPAIAGRLQPALQDFTPARPIVAGVL